MTHVSIDVIACINACARTHIINCTVLVVGALASADAIALTPTLDTCTDAVGAAAAAAANVATTATAPTTCLALALHIIERALFLAMAASPALSPG